MRLVLFAAALACAPCGLAAASPTAPAEAQAQPAPPPGPDSDVVVVGREDRDRQISDFARDLADVGGGSGRADPIPRFDLTRPCPVAVGLSAANNAAIATRMRRVAGAAGIPIAAPGCRPTVLVIVAPDKEEMIRLLRQRYPIFFTNASGTRFEIPPQTGPVTAWHLGGQFDREGNLVDTDGQHSFGVVSSPIGGSLISSAARRVFLAAVVVIEQRAAVGLTTTQIADYATMRAFAGIDPRRLRRTSAPTILTAIEAPADSQVPVTLTEWDLGYLRALYSVAPEHYGQRQLTDIRRQMLRDLGNPEASRD